ncbi:hypothetical protein QMO56_17510 [Roseomonas sp. E05]|uniref:hypothetical protein n=1 Tax=Roseomonas sp. E05 TaxID=3046310 RepID=UPI0024BA057B|nr:hypothetical protein [Roseomonas sp. E05]MDJ0389907.1 hypothetical protein [Roseomonas sp. E05]
MVRSAEQVALALRTAEALGRSEALPLVSPPGAARWLGAPLFLAMVAEGARQAAEGRPPAPLPVLDCRTAPGLALAALRAGLPVVVLEPECPAFAAAEAVARALNAAIWPAPPPAVDLGPGRATAPRTHLRLTRWLAAEEPGG